MDMYRAVDDLCVAVLLHGLQQAGRVRHGGSQVDGGMRMLFFDKQIWEQMPGAHRAVDDFCVAVLLHGLQEASGVGHGGSQIWVVWVQVPALDVVRTCKQVLHLVPLPQLVLHHCQACRRTVWVSI